MKQVEVRVIIVQCLEQDFILDKHYNTVALLCNISNIRNSLSRKMVWWKPKMARSTPWKLR